MQAVGLGEGPPINVHSRSRKCRTTWCPSAALRTSLSFHDGKAKLSSRYSARPLGIRREGRVPGPSPQRGPPSAIGGHLTSSCQARRRGARVRAADQNEAPTPRSINILQWNAEGAYKKITLTEKLHKENIDVGCFQETHLKDNQHFTMRRYLVFRHDREGRAKVGVAILVKNTTPAQEYTVSTNNQA